MSAASSSASARRRRAPFIPLVACPDCGELAVQSRSNTKEHKGWVFYKCRKHGKFGGCNFWHWELEYVVYLLEKSYLVGDAAVEAYGWAEERREALKLAQEEEAATVPGQDEMLLKNWTSMVELLKEAVMLLKIVVALVGVVCVVLISKK